MAVACFLGLRTSRFENFCGGVRPRPPSPVLLARAEPRCFRALAVGHPRYAREGARGKGQLSRWGAPATLRGSRLAGMTGTLTGVGWESPVYSGDSHRRGLIVDIQR